MKKIQLKARIIANKKVSSSHYRLILEQKDILRKARPGQFVHVRVNEGLDPYFRRPFSISRAQEHLELLYAVVGRGTEILSRKKAGDELDLLGPLGNHFCMPPKGTRNVVMIAGAIGIAPFFMLSDYLRDKNYELTLLYGAKTKTQILPMRSLKDNGCRVYIATDDGTQGIKGRVSELYAKIPIDTQKTFIYACGPKPMIDSVLAFAHPNHLKGQVSAEEIMACGIGVCLGCATKTKTGYKTVCKDGPVFDLNEF